MLRLLEVHAGSHIERSIRLRRLDQPPVGIETTRLKPSGEGRQVYCQEEVDCHTEISTVAQGQRIEWRCLTTEVGAVSALCKPVGAKSGVIVSKDRP